MQGQPRFHKHDGSSQAGRMLKALDPGYVSVDERSVEDLLRFAQKYARELHYFNDRNQRDEDWSGFLGDHGLDEIAAYLKDPERFEADAGTKACLSRPHLTLFLTFLELLQHARAQLNDLTRRHLEFYYREALRLTSRKGTPDRVHVLVELTDGQEQFLLPKGTYFQAGEDDLGQPIVFRSDEDLVANHASIGNTRTLFAEKQIIGFAEARKDPDLLIKLFPDNKAILEKGSKTDRSLMAMLMMALGVPEPGSKLEPYLDGRTVDSDLLAELETLLEFVPSVLYMPLSTFRALMSLKDEQDRAYKEKWAKVNNEYLQPAAQNKRKKPDYVLPAKPPANFEKNFLEAMVLTPKELEKLFEKLPEVQDIYDLYRRRDRADVIKFIDKQLAMTPEDFSAMMEIVEEIHGRWRRIYEILRAAAKKKQRVEPGHPTGSPQIRAYEEHKFEALLEATLGKISYASIPGAEADSLDDVLARIVELENYFHLSAEKFLLIREISRKDTGARAWEWQQVYDILEEAHKEKPISDRRKALQDQMKNESFEAMLRSAIGDPKSKGQLPEGRKFEELSPTQDKDYLIEKLCLEPANFTYIRNVQKKDSATPEEWSNVYAILERAQRMRSGWQVRPARIENWKNLYAAPDASQIQVRLQAEGEDVTPRWRTFGKGYSAPEIGKALIAPGEIGMAIASPILALAEGRRKITLNLTFQADHFNEAAIKSAIQDSSPFRFLLSTEKEMILVEKPEMKLLESKRALEVTLFLDERVPAIAPLKTGEGLRRRWPVLQIMLADLPDQSDEAEGQVKPYSLFRYLRLEKIGLSVDVDGLTQLSLQNDDSLLDPKKPFEPFGMSPVAGSSLYFAHPELCSKELNRLTLNIEWLGVPDNLSEHYRGYLKSQDRAVDPAHETLGPSTNLVTDNTGFHARLKLHDNRLLFEAGSLQLFHAEGNSPTRGASKLSTSTITHETITRQHPGYQRVVQLVTAPEVLDWSRYWQLELIDPDFQHAAYPRVAAACASKGVEVDKVFKPKPYIVNPPYTPKIKRLTAEYSSTLELDLIADDMSQQDDRLYYVEPFGFRDLTECASKPYCFLPQFENEGELFIGIRDLHPPQNLALLFQMAEGSADPDLERETVHWSYLDGDTWRSLEEGRLLSDSTNGLLNSGILLFDLLPVNASTLLPPDLYWIRAAIARNSRSVGDIVAIQTQAVSATFEDRGNDPNRLAGPLPAESITGLLEPLPQVRGVHQPYSSFGGKSPEQAGSFYTRVSERLRHKNRTLTSWDYEHMILEKFPGIYKVRCLPAGSSEDPRLADAVHIIVIPDIRGKLPFDPFEPKLPADVLWQIEQYLMKHSPPSTQLIVKNPTYVRLRVRLSARLVKGANPGYYKNLLNEELQRYLAPWAYDRSAEIVFGGRINTSLIVNFLEERPYIDYVAGVKLFTITGGGPPQLYDESATSELEEVTLWDPEAILVSDRSHEIDLIGEEVYEEQFFTGINYLKIELDFQIADESYEQEFFTGINYMKIGDNFKVAAG